MKSFPQLDTLRREQRTVRIYGHRGARGVMPENTVEGFAFVLSLGIKNLELDVVMTADGHPVVTHNPRLLAGSTRLPDGRWMEQDGPRIADLSYAELQRYNVGGLDGNSGYGQRFPDQAFLKRAEIPLLSTVLSMVADRGNPDTRLLIEIKSEPDNPDYPVPLKELVSRMVGVVSDAGLDNQVLFHSFDWRVLQECQQQAPHIPTSYLSYEDKPDAEIRPNVYEGSMWMAGHSLSENGDSVPTAVARAGGAMWCPHVSDISRSALEQARNVGLIVNVWTVNETTEMDRVLALGVDGIVTDYPGRLQRRVLANGYRWDLSAEADKVA